MSETQNWEGYVIYKMTKQYKNDLTRLECWSKTTNIKNLSKSNVRSYIYV